MAACGPYPRDVSGTLDRIENSGALRVGLSELDSDDAATAMAFVTRIERITGATARIDQGSVESQLARLEHGDLDLVIGEFSVDSPWAGSVTIVEPLQRRAVGGHVLGLSPAAANGENAWVALLEREVRNSMGPGA